MRFEGVVPAVLTPFDEGGEVDVGALARNAEWLLASGANGLVGTGTMGEAQSLSAAERRLVIETLAEASGGRVTVSAGVSSETRARSIALARDAAEAGADALMLLPPLGYEGDGAGAAGGAASGGGGVPAPGPGRGARGGARAARFAARRVVLPARHAVLPAGGCPGPRARG